MDIEQRYKPKPFTDLKYGVLFAGTIGERCGIRGIKAHAAPDVGSEDNYFVTVAHLMKNMAHSRCYTIQARCMIRFLN